MEKSIKFLHGFILLFATVLTLVAIQFVAADTDAITVGAAPLPNFFSPIALTSGGTEAVLPAVAISPVGEKVIIAYGLEDAATGVNHDPYVIRSSDNGKTWSLVSQRIYQSATDSVDIDVTYDRLTNRAHAIWVEDSTQLLYSKETSSASLPGWSSPTPIDYTGFSVEELSNPRLFSSGSQTLDIVWRQRNKAGFPSNATGDIYHARSTSRGSVWSIPLNPIIARTEDASLPDLYVDGNTIHVVWQELSNASSFIQKVVYVVSKDGGNTWTSTPTVISSVSGNTPDTAWAPKITVGNNTIHVTFTEKKLVGNSPDREQQYVHHVSCSLSADCTKAFNWESDGVVSGQRLGANDSSPDVVQSAIAMQSNCFVMYFHGVEYQSTADNELVWGNFNCGAATWTTPSKLINSTDQLLRPDMAINQGITYLVYEKIDGFGNSQVQFIRSKSTIYLPVVIKK